MASVIARHIFNTIRHFSTGPPIYERARLVAAPLRSKKQAKSSEAGNTRKFIDWRKVRVQGGNGGDGLIHLASEFGVEFAGPDGGNGGHGGHVIFKAVREVSSLNHVNTFCHGASGKTGGKRNCHGKNAEHTVIEVPVGTIFRNLEREVVAELLTEGDLFIAAKGGAGGKGNSFFKTSTQRAPEIAEAGGLGEEFTFEVEMRTMAHAGFIGFPNAGKSTLLRSISRARPRVAAYPFTTLTPHIGMVPYNDYTQLAVADIPGIIPDAHKNKGLGISFLRHIERCVCLIYVIDASQPTPWEQLSTLKYELEQYQQGLSERPHVVVANKTDLQTAKENLPEFKERVGGQVISLSGKFGSNITELLTAIRKMYDEHSNKS